MNVESEAADSHHADQLALAEIKANNLFLVKNGPFTAHRAPHATAAIVLLRLARSTRHMATSHRRRGAPGFSAPAVKKKKKKKRHSSPAAGITQACARGGV